MNWKRFLLNVGAVAAGGFASAVAQLPAGAAISLKAFLPAVVLPVLANLLGLFQQPPHEQP